jgi:hypothetical protein
MKTYIKTVTYQGHTLEIKALVWEKIFYDGQEVSRKVSLTGTTHGFRTAEEGEEVSYEVSIGTRWHCLSWWVEVERNGELIYSDR